MIEKSKFTYSPLGKAFTRQTKTIEEQRKKLVEVIEHHGKQLVISTAFSEKLKSIPLDKQKEIFYNLVTERTESLCPLFVIKFLLFTK